MSFISIHFFVLLAITLAIYYAPGLARFQVLTLLVASLIFYGWDQWQLLPLLMIAVVLTYAATLFAMQRIRIAVTLGVAGNLIILGFFKYKFLFLGPHQTIFSQNVILNFLLSLPLPIGISFFTFHNISLIVDYYRYGEGREKPKFNDVLLYILFFPQLISGPITRAMSFIPQIVEKRISNIPLVQAVKLLIFGFFFKLFVANNLAQITAKMTPGLMDLIAGGDKILLIFVYSAQIYSDFMGYSTIALGLALLFGFRLPVNFSKPYTSRSFSDFWSRWHISLSTWLRTYLYIPLGGNRFGPFRTYLNLMIVMGLGGLWHGAAISYLFWGLLHGLFLAIERAIQNVIPEKVLLRFSDSRPLTFIYSLFIFLCVSFAWLFFRFEHFPDAMRYLQSISNDALNFQEGKVKYLLVGIYLSPVILQHLIVTKNIFKKYPLVEPILYAWMLYLAVVERGADAPFIYFRF